MSLQLTALEKIAKEFNSGIIGISETLIRDLENFAINSTGLKSVLRETLPESLAEELVKLPLLLRNRKEDNDHVLVFFYQDHIMTAIYCNGTMEYFTIETSVLKLSLDFPVINHGDGFVSINIYSYVHPNTIELPVEHFKIISDLA